jgi:peptide/nickel transport system ATP-binding protein
MPMPTPDLIKVTDLHKYFVLKAGFFSSLLSREPPIVKAVDGVDFTIPQGEILGIVGESGCGKTTLGRTVLRLLEPTSGQVLFDDVDLTTLKRRGLKAYRKEMQLIFQDPFESLNPKMTVYDVLAEPLEIHHLGASRSDRDTLIATALEEVQLIPPRDFFYRYPHELSGGQRQRVALARALILRPRFIVADEPVSMLDVSIRTGVLNLMLDLKDRHGLTYLFITHDLAIAKYMSDRIGVMYLGKIVEYGDVYDVLDDPDHPYTQALMAAVPVTDVRQKKGRIPITGETPQPINIPPGCRFNPRCPYAFDRCLKEEPDLREVEPGHLAACFLSEEFHGGRVARVANISPTTADSGVG